MKRLEPDSGWQGDRSRGAGMGRPGKEPQEPAKPRRFYLQRVPLDSGGYDSGGAYWGLGAPLYRYASTDGEAEGFFRVESRDRAEAFARRGGVRIGEPGADEFRRKFPDWSRCGTREAAKDNVRETFPDATFFR